MKSRVGVELHKGEVAISPRYCIGLSLRYGERRRCDFTRMCTSLAAVFFFSLS